ncbi:MAG: 23S rRNA (uracil(1939)-C(5))-methyltransferase RlmD [Oscillospiraceae bacterium]|jgi:23S rRNA (uracil1939-C5)-methyltransferase|nr:23S rRNA (uracil(1939)-C(5))-methyltransferase RlmD [Oscillospiraceae bacterium]
MLKKNDKVTIEIISLTGEGYGVAKHDEIVVFVPYAAVGDVLAVNIEKVYPRYAYAKIIDIKKPSPDRITPDCPHFGQCGGCDFRHITYAAELHAKEKSCQDAFTRIGKLSPEFLPIIPSPVTDGYRNKAAFPFGTDKDGNTVFGFYRKNTHSIIPCADCPLHPEQFSEIAHFIANSLKQFHILPYDRTTGKGTLRHLFIRRGHNTSDICVTLVMSAPHPAQHVFANRLRKAYPDIHGVVVNINPHDTNVILGANEETLSGKPYMEDVICGLTARIDSGSFYQVNVPLAERLFRVVKSFAEPTGKRILDLYCGTGLIGLTMAREAKEILGLDVTFQSVVAANVTAQQNGITNARFIERDANNLTGLGFTPDLIVLDPTRKGLEGDTAEKVAAFGVPRIVMMSCNPATAARDCAKFAELGYDTKKVQPGDMFPHTKHVECVVLLERR